MKIVMEMDERQAKVVQDALDMYSRMGMGQLDVAVEEFLRTKFYELYFEKEYNPEPYADWKSTYGKRVRGLIDEVKSLVFGHPPNGSWSIHNEKVPQACREAFDIKQVIRKAIIDRKIADASGEGRTWMRFTVDSNPYRPCNPDWPPIKCRVEE